MSIIVAYLMFFRVTVNTVRGLQSADPAPPSSGKAPVVEAEAAVPNDSSWEEAHRAISLA